jgi:polar amino acid transport system permease protein
MTEWIDLFIRNLPDLLNGLIVTIKMTFTGLAIGIAIGLPIALMRVYGKGWVQKFAVGYSEILRGTPLLVQLFLIYYGLPDLGILFSRNTAAILALGLNSGAYQSEYFRGAIQAIGSGQMVAARSIGMKRLQAIRYIILPQALRIVIPSWSNEPVSLIKASAVIFLIAVPDLMMKARSIIGRIYDPISVYFMVAVIYLIFVVILTIILNSIEKSLRIPGLKIDAARR